MKAQLVKREDRWDLYHPERGDKIASSAKSTLPKLSLKNCRAIENGYDLMDLAEKDSNKYYDPSTVSWHCYYNGFFSGFLKAIKLLGDKKYTETDLYRAFLINSAGNNDTLKKFFDETVLPTFQGDFEFDVEIETYIFSTMDDKSGFSERRPKLDDNGCLILKRIEK